MKKKLLLLLTLVLAFSLSACQKKTSNPIVEDAINELTDAWGGIYDRFSVIDDRHLEITNTQVIKIKESVDEEMFENIEYVVQFELLSNYFGSGEPYKNVKQSDCVLVYKDGSMEVSNDIFNIYRARTFNTDFSDIIEESTNYSDAFNQELKIK